MLDYLYTTTDYCHASCAKKYTRNSGRESSVGLTKCELIKNPGKQDIIVRREVEC